MQADTPARCGRVLVGILSTGIGLVVGLLGRGWIADNAEMEYAMQSLVENPAVFEDAIAQNKIMIVR